MAHPEGRAPVFSGSKRHSNTKPGNCNNIGSSNGNGSTQSTGTGRSSSNGPNNGTKRTIFRPTVRALPIGGVSIASSGKPHGPVQEKIGYQGLLLVNRRLSSSSSSAAAPSPSPSSSIINKRRSGADPSTKSHILDGGSTSTATLQKQKTGNPWIANKSGGSGGDNSDNCSGSSVNVRVLSQHHNPREPDDFETNQYVGSGDGTIGNGYITSTIAHSGPNGEKAMDIKQWDEMLDKGIDFSEDIEFGDGTAVRIDTVDNNQSMPEVDGGDSDSFLYVSNGASLKAIASDYISVNEPSCPEVNTSCSNSVKKSTDDNNNANGQDTIPDVLSDEAKITTSTVSDFKEPALENTVISESASGNVVPPSNNQDTVSKDSAEPAKAKVAALPDLAGVWAKSKNATLSANTSSAIKTEANASSTSSGSKSRWWKASLSKGVQKGAQLPISSTASHTSTRYEPKLQQKPESHERKPTSATDTDRNLRYQKGNKRRQPPIPTVVPPMLLTRVGPRNIHPANLEIPIDLANTTENEVDEIAQNLSLNVSISKSVSSSASETQPAVEECDMLEMIIPKPALPKAHPKTDKTNVGPGKISLTNEGDGLAASNTSIQSSNEPVGKVANQTPSVPVNVTQPIRHRHSVSAKSSTIPSTAEASLASAPTRGGSLGESRANNRIKMHTTNWRETSAARLEALSQPPTQAKKGSNSGKPRGAFPPPRARSDKGRVLDSATKSKAPDGSWRAVSSNAQRVENAQASAEARKSIPSSARTEAIQSMTLSTSSGLLPNMIQRIDSIASSTNNNIIPGPKSAVVKSTLINEYDDIQNSLNSEGNAPLKPSGSFAELLSLTKFGHNTGISGRAGNGNAVDSEFIPINRHHSMTALSIHQKAIDRSGAPPSGIATGRHTPSLLPHTVLEDILDERSASSIRNDSNNGNSNNSNNNNNNKSNDKNSGLPPVAPVRNNRVGAGGRAIGKGVIDDQRRGDSSGVHGMPPHSVTPAPAVAQNCGQNLRNSFPHLSQASASLFHMDGSSLFVPYVPEKNMLFGAVQKGGNQPWQQEQHQQISSPASSNAAIVSNDRTRISKVSLSSAPATSSVAPGSARSMAVFGSTSSEAILPSDSRWNDRYGTPGYMAVASQGHSSHYYYSTDSSNDANNESNNANNQKPTIGQFSVSAASLWPSEISNDNDSLKKYAFIQCENKPVSVAHDERGGTHRIGSNTDKNSKRNDCINGRAPRPIGTRSNSATNINRLGANADSSELHDCQQKQQQQQQQQQQQPLPGYSYGYMNDMMPKLHIDYSESSSAQLWPMQYTIPFLQSGGGGGGGGYDGQFYKSPHDHHNMGSSSGPSPAPPQSIPQYTGQPPYGAEYTSQQAVPMQVPMFSGPTHPIPDENMGFVQGVHMFAAHPPHSQHPQQLPQQLPQQQQQQPSTYGGYPGAIQHYPHAFPSQMGTSQMPPPPFLPMYPGHLSAPGGYVLPVNNMQPYLYAPPPPPQPLQPHLQIPTSTAYQSHISYASRMPLNSAPAPNNMPEKTSPDNKPDDGNLKGKSGLGTVGDVSSVSET